MSHEIAPRRDRSRNVVRAGQAMVTVGGYETSMESTA
jgi:hypothetical protein